MTSYTWNGVSGHWRIASDWTPSGGPPTAADAATIGGTGTYTVIVRLSDFASSLTLSDPNATLNDFGQRASLTIGGALTIGDGTLNISPDGDGGSLTVGALDLSGGALNVNDDGTLHLNGTLSQTGGTLRLDTGGTISGGTIDSTAGRLALHGGTLSGVTFDGPLNLTAKDASVYFAGGTTVVGSSGSGPGTINDTGYSSHLYFNYSDTTQTVSDTTINLGNTTPNSGFFDFSEISQNDSASASNLVLTLAPSVTVDIAGRGAFYGGDSSGDEIVNQGVINVTGSGGGLFVYGEDFTNEGTINIANGDLVVLGPSTFTTTASSVIAIGANSYLSLSWDPSCNLGSITLASGAGLEVYGSATTADLGLIANSGGTVYLDGELNNSGKTLNGSESFGQLVLEGGTISGGTVTSAGVAFFDYVVGTLSGVTFEGPLNLTADAAHVDLADGTAVVGSSGAGPGTINVTGDGAFVAFDDTQTVSSLTINLGSSTGNDAFLAERNTAGSGDQVLTLASSVTIDVTGDADIEGYAGSGEGIVNQGTIDQTGGELDFEFLPALTNRGAIDAEAANGSLAIDSTTFANSGAINVANGETATIEPAVTGTGTAAISGNSTLEFDAGVSTAATLGDQNIDFTGAGTLDLLKPTSFYGEISGFAAGDTVELKGTWDFSAISQAAGITTLTLMSGSTTHGFEFVGDYGQSDFSITSGTTTKIGFA